MKIYKKAQLRCSHCLDAISEIKNVFVETHDIRGAFDGIEGIFTYKDGQQYRVKVSPHNPEREAALQAWIKEASKEN